MIKKYTLILLFLIFNGSSFAQQIVTTKGDNVNIADLIIENWQVAGSLNKARSNTDNVYQQGNVGLGDFSATGDVPTQKLDIKGNARVRSMTLANTQLLETQYARDVYADANGNLGYIQNDLSATSKWQFVDLRTSVMSAPVETSRVASSGGSEYVDLGLQIAVTVPAQTQSQFLINYNLPVMHLNRNAIAYMGYTLYKATNGGADTEMQMGSRKYTVPGTYNGGTLGTAMEGYGRPVVGFAIDRVSNSTNTPITIVYKVKGYVEGNGNTVRFGMYTTDAAANKNWGQGMMAVQIFQKAVN